VNKLQHHIIAESISYKFHLQRVVMRIHLNSCFGYRDLAGLRHVALLQHKFPSSLIASLKTRLANPKLPPN